MPTQIHRELEFLSPLGEDVLLLHKFKATEELGRLYNFELDLRSAQEDIDIESILGHNVTVRLNVSGNNERYFNGYITSFSQGENSEGFATYKAVVSPWIWFLQQTKDCQIFQDMSAVDIIEKILADNDYTDYELRLDSSYRRRENTVQYRETSFNFISRLMEEEGIYYFFEHSNDRHKLILCDSSSAHQLIPTYDGIAYYPPDDTTVRNEEIINRWKQEYTVVSGAVAIDDYDFENPKATISNQYSKPKPHTNAEAEVFDYPGNYVTVEEGEHYARVRQEEIQSDYSIIKGKSTAREFTVGALMKMEKHPREDQNIEYLITKVVHKADQDAFGSTQKGGSGFIYKNKFQVVSSITPFRSKRKHTPPLIEGSQNAVVVGPKGEEIHCDKYGRIKVQFPWDRYGKGDENSSCWIRVSQNWAGRKWGAIHIPRIGQEVIVDFLEGNPDRPLVTGKVYNADQMPPYDLPSKKNISGIKTRSSKGGDGFNEMTMDDTKGSEQIFIHAEKQHDQRTNENHLSWVGKHQHHLVEGTYYDDVYGDRHQTVGGELNFFVKDTLSIETQGDIHQKSAQNYAHESGQEIHIKAGTKLVLEAGAQISLKAGGSFIDIGPSGVSIKGAMVNINSGGSPASGIGAEPEKAKLPKEADNRQPPGPASPPKKRKDHDVVPAAAVLRLAAKNNVPFCEECDKAKKKREQEQANNEAETV